MPRRKLPETHIAQRKFIAAFKVYRNTAQAAQAAGIETRTHWDWLNKDESYRKAWEHEQEELGQLLEDEAIRRAHDGVKRQLYYKGRPMRSGRGRSVRNAYETEYSDQLLIALLKRFRPNLYRERTTTELTGSIEIVDRLQAARRRVIEMQRNEQLNTGTAG